MLVLKVAAYILHKITFKVHYSAAFKAFYMNMSAAVLLGLDVAVYGFVVVVFGKLQEPVFVAQLVKIAVYGGLIYAYSVCF